MRNKLSILTLFLLAFIFVFDFGYAQEPEKPPAKRKTFEEAEKQYREQIKQLEQMLQHEREQKQKQLQHQQQLLQMMYEKDITPEQEQQMLERIRKENPAEVNELMMLKKERPIEFKKILIRRQHEFERLEELKESDPARFEQMKKQRSLEYRTYELAEQFRKSADEKEQAKIKHDLSAILGDLFDLREKDREEEIKQLSQKLEQLKSVLVERKNKKKEIVDRRLQELIGERDVLIW